MKVFVSWSGENSREIAEKLVRSLNDIFAEDKEFETFISAENIEGGKAWFEVIRDKLKECDRAIICCTPENVDAPWINFEAGASIMNFEKEGQVIPYLIGFEATDKKSPLSNLHAIKHSSEGFKKLVQDLAKYVKTKYSKKTLVSLIEHSYRENFDNRTIKAIIRGYNEKRIFSTKDIYPEVPKMVKKRSVFLSSPMASLNDDEYEKFHTQMLLVQAAIKKECKSRQVFYPGQNIEKSERFEGKQKAIDKNFIKLKECEYLVVIYPEMLTSSVLVEVGYALALSKKIIIFVKNKEDLPYILQEADKSINNVNLYTYTEVEDIRIKRNGPSFLN